MDDDAIYEQLIAVIAAASPELGKRVRSAVDRAVGEGNSTPVEQLNASLSDAERVLLLSTAQTCSLQMGVVTNFFELKDSN